MRKNIDKCPNINELCYNSKQETDSSGTEHPNNHVHQLVRVKRDQPSQKNSGHVIDYTIIGLTQSALP